MQTKKLEQIFDCIYSSENLTINIQIVVYGMFYFMIPVQAKEKNTTRKQNWYFHENAK